MFESICRSGHVSPPLSTSVQVGDLPVILLFVRQPQRGVQIRPRYSQRLQLLLLFHLNLCERQFALSEYLHISTIDVWLFQFFSDPY